MTFEEFIYQVEGNDSHALGDGKFGSTWDYYGRCWNIGPGLTRGITKTTVMTQDQIDAAFGAETAAVRAAVDHLVKVPLTDNQRIVLMSFAYNTGVSGFAHSSVLTYVNEKRYADVPAHLKLYNKAHGKVVKGLINRRLVECHLWQESPTTLSPATPPASSTSKGA